MADKITTEDAVACAMMAMKEPRKVPVVVYVAPAKRHAWILSKHRFLVPESLSYPMFLHYLRRHIHLAPSEAIYGTLLLFPRVPPASGTTVLMGCNLTMGELRQEHAPGTRYLAILIDGENVFG